MSRIWRWIAPVAVAGGLIAAAGAFPAEAASPAAYGITLSIKTGNPTVTKDSLVIYKDTTKGADTAKIHGQITGATAGDVATLMSETFKASHFTSTGQTVTLSGSSQTYSFTVRPSLVTRYEVEVTTGSTVDIISAPQTLYVTLIGVAKGEHVRCGRTSCALSVTAFVHVPASAYKTETGKHVYVYLAVGRPRLPKYYTLETSGRASRPRRINSGEYKFTVTWFIPLHVNFEFTFCTRDSITVDGLGLPGHHGCGDRRVNIRQANLYLG